MTTVNIRPGCDASLGRIDETRVIGMQKAIARLYSAKCRRLLSHDNLLLLPKSF